MNPIPRHPQTREQKALLSRARTHGFFAACHTASRRAQRDTPESVQAVTIRCERCGKTLLAGTVDGPLVNTVCKSCKTKTPN